MPSLNWADIVTILVGVIVAAIWLKSALVKQRHEELEQLAETRGQRIKDQDAKIEQLSAKVDRLEGQIIQLQALKVTEIVDAVVEGLETRLLGQ